jgi:hypothetical protein
MFHYFIPVQTVKSGAQVCANNEEKYYSILLGDRGDFEKDKSSTLSGKCELKDAGCYSSCQSEKFGTGRVTLKLYL